MVSYYDYHIVVWHVVPMALSSETKVFRSIGMLEKLLFGQYELCCLDHYNNCHTLCISIHATVKLLIPDMFRVH